MEKAAAQRAVGFEAVARWRELARRRGDGKVILDAPDKVSIIGADRKSAEATIAPMGNERRSSEFDAAYGSLIKTDAAKQQSYGVYVGGLLVIVYDMQKEELVTFADEMETVGVLRS